MSDIFQIIKNAMNGSGKDKSEAIELIKSIISGDDEQRDSLMLGMLEHIERDYEKTAEIAEGILDTAAASSVLANECAVIMIAAARAKALRNKYEDTGALAQKVKDGLDSDAWPKTIAEANGILLEVAQELFKAGNYPLAERYASSHRDSCEDSASTAVPEALLLDIAEARGRLGDTEEAIDNVEEIMGEFYHPAHYMDRAKQLLEALKQANNAGVPLPGAPSAKKGVSSSHLRF